MRTAPIAVLKDSADTALEHLADEAAFDRFARETAAEWAAHIEDSRAGDAFPARRVLCAHRRGPFGANRFNRLVERRLRDSGSIPANDEFYPGRPIIVTRNDRATGLSNGDTGVVILDSHGRRRVWFPDLAGPGGIRCPASRLAFPSTRTREFLRPHRASRSGVRIRRGGLHPRRQHADTAVARPQQGHATKTPCSTRDRSRAPVNPHISTRRLVTVRADEDTVAARWGGPRAAPKADCGALLSVCAHMLGSP